MKYDDIVKAKKLAGMRVEKDMLKKALVSSGWCRGRAAESLMCHVSTLARAISRHPVLMGRLVDGRKNKD